MSTATLSAPALDAVARLAREQFHTGLTVTDLADHAGYSPFHFSRLFTQAARIPPGQFLTALRVDAAKRALLGGDDAVIDIATAVGFDSLSSFSRRFRATVGVPPGELRRLADRIADAPARPFRLAPPGGPSLRIVLDVPEPLRPRGTLTVWVGWYRQPAPVGLPAAGALVEYGDDVSLPLCPGAPWLLGFAVPADADPRDQLTPAQPLVAVHPAPVEAPPPSAMPSASASPTITLGFAAAGPTAVPLLTALPSLCRHLR